MKPVIRCSLFILFCCTFSSPLCHAQIFKGGVHAGLVGSQVAGDLFSGYNKAGISAGGWVSLQFSVHHELQMELSYIQKGSRENPDYEKDKMDSYLMRLGYVELPLVYRLIYSNKLNFETGLAMDFLIHSSEEYNGDELDAPFDKSNLCCILGLTYNLTDKIKVGLRTNNSIFSIRKDRVNGDVWRFFEHGQYNDALILGCYFRF